MEDNAIPFLILLFIIIGLFIYFLPSIIARKKRDALSIFLLNLFLGATGIGWVIALVWACKKDTEPTIIYIKKNEQPALNPAVGQTINKNEDDVKTDSVTSIENDSIEVDEPQKSTSRFYLDVIMILIVLSLVIFFGYKFYRNRVQDESVQIGLIANNWSDADKNGLVSNLNEFINKSGRDDVIKKKEEISNCIIKEIINKYPAFEDFKREFVNDRNIVKAIVSKCLIAHGLEEM